MAVWETWLVALPDAAARRRSRLAPWLAVAMEETKKMAAGRQGSVWSLWPAPHEERILWALGSRSHGEVGPLTSLSQFTSLLCSLPPERLALNVLTSCLGELTVFQATEPSPPLEIWRRPSCGPALGHLSKLVLCLWALLRPCLWTQCPSWHAGLLVSSCRGESWLSLELN